MLVAMVSQRSSELGYVWHWERACVCACARVRACACARALACTCVCLRVFACVCVCVRVFACACVCTCVHVYARVFAFVFARARVLARVFARARARARVCVCVPSSRAASIHDVCRMVCDQPLNVGSVGLGWRDISEGQDWPMNSTASARLLPTDL